MSETGLGALARSAGMTILAILCLAPSAGRGADDPSDAAFLAPVLQRTLETARTNVEIPWRNPATGHRGNIVVERTFYREPDRPCRGYVRTLEPPIGALQVTRGTGCRTSGGYWDIEEQPETAAAPTPGATERGPAGAPPGSPPGREERDVADAEAGPTCPDTVLVPLPAVRPPELAYTLPARAEL